jgi:glutamate synthase (ferredoxin)
VNTDRSILRRRRSANGARISGAIALKYGDSAFEGQLTLNFEGAAGQSFGAFNHEGVSLNLTGESNDYVGKGINGGEIVIKPHTGTIFDTSRNVIIGNTCLYGATGGYLYANGRAGERFAVRNSRATAVVEGTGDHCCEYMTGGVVVVLGQVGRNVGAGMTGGLGYFLDEDDTFIAKINPEIVKWQRVQTAAGEQQLKDLIAAHGAKTGSQKAQEILSRWAEYLPKFWQLVPPSEAETPEASAKQAVSA